MKLPDSPALQALIAALGGGETTRFIGGVVRDTALGLPVSDIDLATRLTPDAVLARLALAGIKAVPTGLAHGTVTAVTKGGPVEVTTLRRDVATDGRHATVAFTDDWKEDAARRDFTINALSANPETGEIFDYFGGTDDLNAGCVRFIGEPYQRIAEDHLRILRFFRFFARFGRGEPDDASYDACAARANDLMALSRERIAAELLKLLASDDPVAAVRLMLDRDVLAPVLPEIQSSAALARVIRREHDFVVEGNALRRLAALIGPDPAVGRDVALRLRLSKAQARRLALACGFGEARETVEVLAYWIGDAEAIDRLLLGDGSDAEFAALAGWQKPTLPVTGGALVNRGLKTGPDVSTTLKAIERAWVDSGFPTGKAFDEIVDRELGAVLPR